VLKDLRIKCKSLADCPVLLVNINEWITSHPVGDGSGHGSFVSVGVGVGVAVPPVGVAVGVGVCVGGGVPSQLVMIGFPKIVQLKH
jgi:hypothetical protein